MFLYPLSATIFFCPNPEPNKSLEKQFHSLMKKLVKNILVSHHPDYLTFKRTKPTIRIKPLDRGHSFHFRFLSIYLLMHGEYNKTATKIILNGY